MKKFMILSLLIISPLFSYSTSVTAIYAIGIFNSAGNGENVQHVRRTKANYNGTCYTKVFVVGNAFNTKPEVKIGNSIGTYQSTKPIYSETTNKIKIGEVMVFKHLNVSKGLIKIFFKNRLFDSKVYVK